jgi:uncharacterized caspase-like protein
MARASLLWLVITVSLAGCGPSPGSSDRAQRSTSVPAAEASSPAERVALVIGNSAYGGRWPDLQGGPLRDAELMRKVLTDLKFEVLYRSDADLPQMEAALRDLRGALLKAPGALALVYYSGHGATRKVRVTFDQREYRSHLSVGGCLF